MIILCFASSYITSHGPVQSGPTMRHKAADSGSPKQGGFHTNRSWVGWAPCQHNPLVISEDHYGRSALQHPLLKPTHHYQLVPVVIFMVLARVLGQGCGFSPMAWWKGIMNPLESDGDSDRDTNDYWQIFTTAFASNHLNTVKWCVLWKGPHSPVQGMRGN